MFKTDSTTLSDTRNQLHWASQLLSAAADAKLENAQDDSHTNLAWNSETDTLEGRAGVNLNVNRFAIEFGDESFSLVGQTLSDAAAWLGNQLGEEIKFREYEMPEHDVGSGAPFAPDNDRLAAIAQWFSFGLAALEGNGELRIWPHHFDLGFWKNSDVEGQSIGGGFSLGDRNYDQPYFYVNPYGIEQPDSLPDLAHGGWTEHWTGAVLLADELDDANDASHVASHFISNAIEQCKLLQDWHAGNSGLNQEQIMNVHYDAEQKSTDEFRDDVIAGLGADRKSLPCKYFYDETGSKLFDQICELDEYYPTRTELGIMQANSASIADQIDRRVMLVEYGSGSSTKTRILLDSLIDPVAYVPVDISEEHLLKTAEGLRLTYPEIEILPVAADFTKPFSLPETSSPYSHIALYFPGSTIGNFAPNEAIKILGQMSDLLGDGGGLLIGIDLQKDVQTLIDAYDDSEGVTAEFNLNLLTRINTELNGDFDLDQFAHKAIYNHACHRIEISIVSLREQQVTIGDQVFQFALDEETLTEYSHKYTIEGFEEIAAHHGFRLHKHWTDDKNLFGVLHLVLERSNT